MSPTMVHILRVIFGPGKSDVYDPVFDRDGNLESYPDLARIKRKIDPTYGGWRKMSKDFKKNKGDKRE